jgi:hypothetical protein
MRQGELGLPPANMIAWPTSGTSGLTSQGSLLRKGAGSLGSGEPGVMRPLVIRISTRLVDLPSARISDCSPHSVGGVQVCQTSRTPWATTYMYALSSVSASRPHNLTKYITYLFHFRETSLFLIPASHISSLASMAESGSMEAKAQPHANLNALGIFWIAFALSWTLIVAGGMIFLWRRRDMPILRIRGLPLSFLAVTLLHLYWGAVQTGYVWFPLAAPEIEYWIMSIYLPCGIALFHASNSRFLHVAKAQKELFASDSASIKSKPAKAKSCFRHFRSLNYNRKILVLVGAGMIFQVMQLVGWYSNFNC